MNAGVKAPRWAGQGTASALQPQAGSDGTDRPASNYGGFWVAPYCRLGRSAHSGGGKFWLINRNKSPRPNQPAASTLHSLWDGGVEGHAPSELLVGTQDQPMGWKVR